VEGMVPGRRGRGHPRRRISNIILIKVLAVQYNMEHVI
jgi:hypothetical protein